MDKSISRFGWQCPSAVESCWFESGLHMTFRALHIGHDAYKLEAATAARRRGWWRQWRRAIGNSAPRAARFGSCRSMADFTSSLRRRISGPITRRWLRSKASSEVIPIIRRLAACRLKSPSGRLLGWDEDGYGYGLPGHLIARCVDTRRSRRTRLQKAQDVVCRVSLSPARPPASARYGPRVSVPGR